MQVFISRRSRLTRWFNIKFRKNSVNQKEKEIKLEKLDFLKNYSFPKKFSEKFDSSRRNSSSQWKDLLAGELDKAPEKNPTLITINPLLEQKNFVNKKKSLFIAKNWSVC